MSPNHLLLNKTTATQKVVQGVGLEGQIYKAYPLALARELPRVLARKVFSLLLSLGPGLSQSRAYKFHCRDKL